MKCITNTLARVFLSLVFIFLTSSVAAAISEDMKNCLMQAMEHAEDSTVLMKMQQLCEQVASSTQQQDVNKIEQEGVVTTKSDVDESNILKPFTLMAHRPNYLLFGAYNSNGYGTDDFVTTYDEQSDSFKDTEAAFR